MQLHSNTCLACGGSLEFKVQISSLFPLLPGNEVCLQSEDESHSHMTFSGSDHVTSTTDTELGVDDGVRCDGDVVRTELDLDEEVCSVPLISIILPKCFC